MKTSIKLPLLAMLVGALASCSGGSDGGGSNPGGGSSTSSGSTTGPVSEVAGTVMVPATFAGQPAKIIFGYGSKQITDGNGKMLNIPTAFLPSLAGVPNPAITPGQAYSMDMSGLDIPEGDYYVLVALYVQGTAGTIPQQGKDYIAGTTTTVHFSGSKLTLPPLTFQVSQGM